MSQQNIHRFTAFIVFLIAAVTYFITAQPSVSFWDCGEFIASSYSLQVPHPPGTPFFILIGRLLSMIPFAENIAFRVNTISIFSSALVILFLYLSAVKLIENYNNHINLALSYIRPKQPSLIIMHGFSGAGKTKLASVNQINVFVGSDCVPSN